MKRKPVRGGRTLWFKVSGAGLSVFLDCVRLRLQAKWGQ